MMVTKLLAESKRLRMPMASQEGVIARWCGGGEKPPLTRLWGLFLFFLSINLRHVRTCANLIACEK